MQVLFLFLDQVSPPVFDILQFEDNENGNGGHLKLRNRPHVVPYSNKLLSCYYYRNALQYNFEYGPEDKIEEKQV